MYVIGIGGSIDEDEIMQMSSTPQTEGQTFWLLDWSDLGLFKSVNDVLTRICGSDPTKAEYYGKRQNKDTIICYSLIVKTLGVLVNPAG